MVELHERLVILTPNAPTLENPVRLEPLGGGQFRFVAPVGGGPVGEVPPPASTLGGSASSSARVGACDEPLNSLRIVRRGRAPLEARRR